MRCPFKEPRARRLPGVAFKIGPSGFLTEVQAGDFQRSIDAAWKALDRQPDYAEAYNNLAASFASLQKWDEAIQAAREALPVEAGFSVGAH